MTLEKLGGAANVSTKEWYEEHAAVVEALTKAGEPTSSVAGSRIDKRTLTTTLNELESQERVRTFKTAISSSTGSVRQATIVYLADMSQEQLNDFVRSLTFVHPFQSTTIPLPSIKIVDSSLEYGGSRSKRISKPQASVILLDPGHKEHDPQQAEQLLRADEATIKASLLTEPNTVVQQYGFIVGKIARVRELHIHILRLMDEQNCPSIISANRRIIHLSYFFQELPVSVHTAVITCRVHNEDVLRLLSTPEGRQTPLRQLSSSIQEAFEINRARTRTKMLENLALLEALGLVVPLRVSEGGQPFVSCEPGGDHPNEFQRTSYDSTSTLDAPPYWMFSRSASLFLWALDESNPPFYRVVSINSSAEAERFWEDLRQSSLDGEVCKKILVDQSLSGQVPAEQPSPGNPLAVVKLLRRQTQWRTAYNFSWFQKQYLKKFIDVGTAKTPLGDEDSGEARLSQIASIVSAPKDQVARFYEHERKKLLKDIKRMQRRKANKDKTKEEKKASLAQKAAAAKAQHEREWDEMVTRIQPEPMSGTLASRVRVIRSRFLQSSGRDLQKWEAEVKNVIEETRLTAARPRPPLPQIPLRPLPVLPSLPPSSNEKSVEEVIALQGPRPEKLAKTKTKGKGKKKRKAKEQDEDEEEEEDGRSRHDSRNWPPRSSLYLDKQRRQRFQWNKHLDELACDASAIIRARCGPGKRVQWAALEQIFPATTPNSVRQRVAHISAQPGQDAYMKRLEDRWCELWKLHYGTPELPDEDPGSATNFDLVAHVKFLRKHIDKDAL